MDEIARYSGCDIRQASTYQRQVQQKPGGVAGGFKDSGVSEMIEEQLYLYRWGNNSKRVTMKGRICRVLARGKKNSCSIEFIDNGQQEVVSRNSLKKQGSDEEAKAT